MEATPSHPEDLAKIMNEGGYTKQQTSSANETALHLKKMPSKTPIAIGEKSVLSFSASKDRWTLWLGASVVGDFKLKPALTCHSENPRALQNYANSALPVLSKWNNKAWLAAHLFTTWFTEHFKPTVET